MNKPIVELYEYQIIGQPADISTISKFGNIEDSPTNSITNSLSDCSRVSIEGLEDSKLPDLFRTSCDPIHSIKDIAGGAPLKKYKFYDINNLYDNYKFFLSKNTEVIEEISDSSKQSINENMDIIIKQQLELINSSLTKTPNLLLEEYKKKIENLDSVGDKNTQFTNIGYTSATTALIQKINISSDNKLIMMGDFHGSFHAFFRLLCRFHRYGILNLETFIINEPYKIIFLGDILDRGKYALDIINIIFKLIAINNNDINNQKIFFNRGNHESYEVYQRDGGLVEFTLKINMETKNKDKIIDFIIKFNKVLSLLPSALIITCDKTKFWCSHGGFPRLYLTEKIPDDDIVIVDDVTPANKTAAKDIRWSDFKFNSDYSLEHVLSNRGGNILAYSYTGTLKFLNNNNINFIIRGHQDSFGNSFYLKNDLMSSLNVINNPINQNIDNFLYYNNASDPSIMRVNGPIARMITDKNTLLATKSKHPIPFFPVLTISTNMDAGRALTADSFALLRFDINEADITDFTKNTLSIVNNINSLISGKSNINKGNLLLNILNITTDILNFFNDDTLLNLLNFVTNYDKYVFDKDKDNNVMKFMAAFGDMCITLNQIFDDINDIYLYYNNKTTNLITKLTLYNQKINSQSIVNIIKKYNDKIEEINHLFAEIKGKKDVSTLFEKHIISKYIKQNLYMNIKKQNKYNTPKINFILDKINTKIAEYNDLEN